MSIPVDTSCMVILKEMTRFHENSSEHNLSIHDDLTNYPGATKTQFKQRY
jgi:hypothetical protein